MRSGASYSVRSGSLRVRKVVTTNSQGKKKTVKKLSNFNLLFQEQSNSMYFRSRYIKVGISLEVRYFLMRLSVLYQLKLGVE